MIDVVLKKMDTEESKFPFTNRVCDIRVCDNTTHSHSCVTKTRIFSSFLTFFFWFLFPDSLHCCFFVISFPL